LLIDSAAELLSIVLWRITAEILWCIFGTASNQASSAAVIGPGPVVVGAGVRVAAGVLVTAD
jgi:hypothetical protein